MVKTAASFVLASLGPWTYHKGTPRPLVRCGPTRKECVSAHSGWVGEKTAILTILEGVQIPFCSPFGFLQSGVTFKRPLARRFQ